MSALTDLFTSFANKIRSKVGGSQTYTPLEMVDAIDDVYDAGAASVPTPTSITPSNDSPVALAADTPVNPTAGGYAIESYQSKTPSASGVSFNSGMVKMSSNGYAFSALPPNFMSPDKTQVISSSTGGTTNISVAQKPRYIIMATWNAAGSQYGGMLGVVDVANGTAKRLGYSSNGTISWSNWSGYTDYFTSITSSQVAYKSNWSTNTATRSMILIYY